MENNIMDRSTLQESGSITEDMISLVYEELRHLAARMMSRESHTEILQATALVHEAFLRLIRTHDKSWHNRAHFVSAAAETMRRILIEAGRRRQSQQRARQATHQDWQEIQIAMNTDPDLLIAIDEALARLEMADPVKAELVKLRFFIGLTIAESARVLRIAERTARWHWTFARAWLYHELTTHPPLHSGQRVGEPRNTQ
jgi:RNA polymerase sigma factor (TIGR02999 family)